MSKLRPLLGMYVEIRNLSVSRRELERELARMIQAETSTEDLLVNWSMSDQTGRDGLSHPVLNALASARQSSGELDLPWTKAVAKSVAKRALVQHGHVPLPQDLVATVNNDVAEARRNLQSLEGRLSSLQGSYCQEKEFLRAAVRDTGFDSVYERSFRYPPPVLRAVPETANIAAQRGRREAPAELLLSIAHGLATGEHWWLCSPADRKRSSAEIPAPSSLEDVVGINQALEDQLAPRVRLISGRFEWAPLQGNLDTNYDRKIVICVEPGASTGTISWCTGKWIEQGEAHTCSSFIGAILAILPKSEDTGEISQMLAHQDQEEARRIRTIRNAQAELEFGRRIIDETIYHPETGEMIASAYVLNQVTFHFHLGPQPRRSWTPDGQERRIARWLTAKEREAMVASAQPLPWTTDRREDGVEVMRPGGW